MWVSRQSAQWALSCITHVSHEMITLDASASMRCTDDSFHRSPPAMDDDGRVRQSFPTAGRSPPGDGEELVAADRVRPGGAHIGEQGLIVGDDEHRLTQR